MAKGHLKRVVHFFVACNGMHTITSMGNDAGGNFLDAMKRATYEAKVVLVGSIMTYPGAMSTWELGYKQDLCLLLRAPFRLLFSITTIEHPISVFIDFRHLSWYPYVFKNHFTSLGQPFKLFVSHRLGFVHAGSKNKY